MKRTILTLLIFTVGLFGIGYSSLAQQNSGEALLDILCAGKSATEDEIVFQKEGYTYELNQGQRHAKQRAWHTQGEDLIFTLKGLKTEDKYVLLLDCPILTARKLAVNVYISDVLVLEDWRGVKTPLQLNSEWYVNGKIKLILEPKGPGAAVQHIKLFSAKSEEAVKKILSQLKEVKEEGEEEIKEEPKEEIKEVIVEKKPGDIMREIIIIPTTHMDIDYIASPEESLNKYDQYIMEAIELIEENERLYYSIEHCLALEHFLRNHPEYKERLKGLIEEGKIEVMANWSTPHFADLSGEHIIRQFAYSQCWLKKNFGVMSSIGNNGELCDPTLQLAQILNKCGIKFYHNFKIHSFPTYPRKFVGKNSLLFGLDGSFVLFNNNTYNMPKQLALYNYPDGKDNFLREFTLPLEIEGYPEGTKINFYEIFNERMQGKQALWCEGGEGDDSFPDLAALDNFVQGWNENDAEKYNLKFRLGTFKDFHNKLSEDIDKESLELPRIIGHTEHGELLYYAWGWTKYRDRAYVEDKLLDVEKLSSIFYSLGLSKYPEEKINKAWENIMAVSTHNWGFKDADKLFPQMATEARKITDELLKEKMSLLADSINYSKKAKAVVVFNPLNWQRTNIVRVKLESLSTTDVSVIDKEGKKTLFQIVSPQKDELIFIAEKVPSIGYKTYYIIENEEDTPALKKGELFSDINASENTIENRYYRISADRLKGIRSVYDKLNERELFIGSLGDIRTTAVEGLGLERLYQEKEATSSEVMKAIESLESEIVVEDIKVTETGPAAATITVRGKIMGSTITLQVSLFAGINRIDLKISATPLPFEKILDNLKANMSSTDYNIFRKNAREGIIFYLPLHFNLSDKAITRASIPYASLTLARAMEWGEKTTEATFSQRTAGADGWLRYFNENYHLPLQSFVSAKLAKASWADIYDNNEYGITYAMEHSFNQFIRDKDNFNVFYKSLFQNGSQGHIYRFSFRAHKGSWQEANSPRFGAEISHPLMVAMVNSEKPIKKSKLPEEKSFLTIDQENIILTTLKKSFTDEGIVARFYETYDIDTEVVAKINLYPSSQNQIVSRTDMNDINISDPIILENGKYIISIKGSSIETIKIKIDGKVSLEKEM